VTAYLPVTLHLPQPKRQVSCHQLQICNCKDFSNGTAPSKVSSDYHHQHEKPTQRSEHPSTGVFFSLPFNYNLIYIDRPSFLPYFRCLPSIKTSFFSISFTFVSWSMPAATSFVFEIIHVDRTALKYQAIYTNKLAQAPQHKTSSRRCYSKASPRFFNNFCCNLSQSPNYYL